VSLRPAAARWFEVLVVRDDLPAAIAALARTARVELQSHGEVRAPLLTEAARRRLETFDTLAGRFEPYWPDVTAHDESERSELEDVLENAIRSLEAWAEGASDTIARREALDRRRDDLSLLAILLREATGRFPDLKSLVRAGPLLSHCLYRLEPGQWPATLPNSVITTRFAAPEDAFLLAVGLTDDVAELEQQLALIKARRIELPGDLPATTEEALQHVRVALEETDAGIEACDQVLAELGERHGIGRAIADVGFVRWYLDTVPEQSTTEHFAWITGWTCDPDAEGLSRILAAKDIKALVRTTSPPPGLTPPLVLRNPGWMRPFEVFTSMLGVPRASEVDPTRIVAVVSPLMFGYMFGDVGHGAVVLVAGLLLSRRLPAMRLLVAGGAVSIVFGFVFGSVFSLENVLPALWLRPIENPLPVIFVPIVGGSMVLLTGMVLEALQAYWGRHARLWWQTDAGLVLCYVALFGAIWQPALLYAALVGLLWFVAGHGIVAAHHRLAAAGAAAVEFLETLLQLAVNTVSFVRVGAFALAHAGLSMAIVGLAAAAGSVPGRVTVLIVGNVIVILLEGLVVGIQTTRLVLFEFFVRFMRGEGRPFKPLTPAGLDPVPGQRRPT